MILEFELFRCFGLFIIERYVYFVVIYIFYYGGQVVFDNIVIFNCLVFFGVFCGFEVYILVGVECFMLQSSLVDFISIGYV